MEGSASERLAHLRNQVLAVGRRMVEHGLVLGTEGNVSALDRESGLVVITPSKARGSLAELEAADLVVVDREGRLVEGRRPPSSEVALHCAVYQEGLRECAAIVHTHSLHAIVLGVAGRELQPLCVADGVRLGRVPLVPYALPGSAELARAVAAALRESGADAALLRNHGALALGSDPDEALLRARVLERACQMMVYLALMGAVGPGK